MKQDSWTWSLRRQTWWPRPGNGFELLSWLDAADGQAPLAERNVWLIRVLDWVRRGEPVSGTQAVLRHVTEDPARLARIQHWLAAFWRDIDVAALLADHGLADRGSLRSEWAERLRRKCLPLSPDNADLGAWFELLLRAPEDSDWLAELDDGLLDGLGDLMVSALPEPQAWRDPFFDAMAFLGSQVRSAGMSSAFRLRLGTRLDAGEGTVQPVMLHGQRAFRALGQAVEQLHELDRARREAMALAANAATTADASVLSEVRAADLALLQQSQYLRGLLDQCVQAASGLHGHLESHGISVELVFQIDQLCQRCARIEQLLDVVLAERPAPEVRRLLLSLMRAGQARRSLRAWLGQQHALLARKVTERSAAVGEHYITRNHSEYRGMLASAAGGGAVLALTTFMKFAVLGLAWSPFWLGMGAGLNYAASFVLVQLLHFTVATKQPAMTAPALSARLAEAGTPEGEARFVDEVAHLMRSQVAGILGNLLAVAPLVAAVQALAIWWRGQPLVGPAEARHVIENLTLLGPTLAFAAFTGVLLFASSILSGWAENWFVLHRVDSALRWNPRIQAWLGPQRAQRWSEWWRANVAGLAANVSLGLMLGLVPVLAHFMALPLDVRHVTLSTGQWVAAVMALGQDALREPAVWWCALALPLTGVLNVGVSFWLAWRLAVRARGLRFKDRARLGRALGRRLREQPASFFWPPREPALVQGGGESG